MVKIYAIVANEVLENKRVSFKFMFDSNAPFRDFMNISDRFGLLTLKPRPDDFIDVFAIGNPEQQDQDKQVKRWNLNVFESGGGLILASGVDWDEKMDGITKLIRETSDFVLLTHLEALEGLQTACQNAGIELTVFRYDGVLATS